MRYEALEWDSAFFGLPIGRISDGPVDADGLRAAVADADADGVQCLYFLCPGGEDGALQSAVDLGFRPHDVRLEFQRALSHLADAPASTHEARSDETPELERIARERFRGTRFWNDPRFPRERVGDLYAAWLKRGLSTPPQRKTRVAGAAQGFVICRFDPDLALGTIELIAVAEEGKGLGAALLADANRAFAEAGLERAAVVTQGENVAAQRLYQRFGYRTTRVDHWLHRWAD